MPWRGPDCADVRGTDTEARRRQMTTGSDNLSNGSGTAQDRFSGGVSAYRQTRREAAIAAENGDGELLGYRDSSPLPTRSPGMSGNVSHGIEPTSALDRAAKLPSLDL